MRIAKVISRSRLTPQMNRVVLGGDGLRDFEMPQATDAYINCLCIPEGAPYSVPFTEASVNELPREQRPLGRRITVRSWDADRRELTLDIAHHGDAGYMGPWAAQAEPGELLQFKGPGGGYYPSPEADGYLYVGDESALPAIAASLEQVPEGRPVTAIIEVENAAGEIGTTSPGNLTLEWIYREGQDDLDNLLAQAVAALPRTGGTLEAFVHGEAVATRAVRRVLLSDKRVTLENLDCSPYWRRGYDDEAWRQIKGAWVREVNAEEYPA